MGSKIERGSIFPEKLQKEIFNKVKGHSTLAKLTGQSPVPFTGTKIVTFTMDKDIDIVAESGAKSNGGATLAPVSMVPIKVEYGARVSDEFLYASEEDALDILAAWQEGFAKKLARGIDIMAFHGVNPRTGNPSDIIGTNSFDTNTGVAVIDYDATDIEGNLEDAVAATSEDLSGYAFGKSFAATLGKLKANGIHQFPEFRLGGNPEYFMGNRSDVNATVEYGDVDKAIVGDFANAFKYGIAKEIPYEVIQYGNPDNDATLGDLKGHNQVYLRSEAYIGWAILDPSAFARIAVSGE